MYLAVVLDAYSRKVVGWALGRQLDASLPLLALERALAKHPPPRGWVHRSDCGFQYASRAYIKRLEAAGAILSMSRPGRPWEDGKCDNNGNGTFTDVTKKAGLLKMASRWTTSAVWLDYDNDGRLDPFLRSYVAFDPREVLRLGASSQVDWVELAQAPAESARWSASWG